MSPTNPGAAFNEQSVKNWLHTLFDNCEGYIHISYVTLGATYRTGKFFATSDIDKAVSFAKYLDSETAQSIYVRMSTLADIPETGKRGGERETKHLPVLWADIDLGTEGHKHELCPGTCTKPHVHKTKPLPSDSFEVFDILDNSDIPEPTCWQFSGGGLYPFWLLDKPFDASTPKGLDKARELADSLEMAIHGALAEAGYHYGMGISNIDRILRLPGTVNRKTDNWRQSNMLPTDSTIRYSFDGLARSVRSIAPVKLEEPRIEVKAPEPTRLDRAKSPLDAFSEVATIADLLEPLGWEKVGGSHPEELWRRPGASSPYSARWNHDGVPVLVVHSAEAELPAGAGQNLTLARVLAHLHFNGSTEAAARGLLEAAGGNPGATLTLPERVLEHVRTSCDVRRYDGHKTAAPEPPIWVDEQPEQEDPFEQLHEMSSLFDDPEVSATSQLLSAIEVDELLASEDAPYDWLVPGLLERGDRLIITAAPGAGKSTLVRQLGIQTASGIHPFSLNPIEPIKVLLIDFENTVKQTKRKMRTLRVAAGKRYKSSPGFHIVNLPAGTDVMQAEDRKALYDLIDSVRPDLLMMGPIYKMVSGEPKDEIPAKTAAMWCDKVRTDFNCAIILEAHSAKGSSDGKSLPMTPYGASLWTRWPEFGFFITASDDESDLIPWRGARDEREWPRKLKRGGDWPWTVDLDILTECAKDFSTGDPSSKKTVEYRGHEVTDEEEEIAKILVQKYNVAYDASSDAIKQVLKQYREADLAAKLRDQKTMTLVMRALTNLSTKGQEVLPF